MKQTTKRVIAREGLIIITLCITGVILLVLDARQQSKFYEYERTPKVYVRIDSSNINASFPKSTRRDIMLKALKRDFNITELPIIDPFFVPDVVEEKYDSNGELLLPSKWKNIGPLLVFAYPLYLLIRFVVWAIKTLRTKEEVE